MRLLYFAPLDPSLHLGNAVHVRRLVEAFEARGHQVRLICRGRNEGDWAPRGGIVSIGLEGPRRWRHLRAEWQTVRQIERDRRAFAPDLLLVRQEWYALVPLLLSLRTPLIIESNASLPGMGRIAGLPAAQVRCLSILEGRAQRRAAAVGALSRRLLEIQIRRHRLDRAKVGLTPMGTWLPPLPPASTLLRLRRERGVADDSFVLAFVGNLHRIQGLDRILRAMAALPREKLSLWIVGEGVEEASLCRLAREQGLAARVEFLGALPEAEAALYSQAAQLLLAPYDPASLDATGIDPSKILQAMACDRPVLVPDHPDLAIVERMGVGSTVSRAEPEAWAAAIGDWSRRWAEAGRPQAGWPWPPGEGPGRAYVLAERTWDHGARAWEALWERILPADMD